MLVHLIILNMMRGMINNYRIMILLCTAIFSTLIVKCQNKDAFNIDYILNDVKKVKLVREDSVFSDTIKLGDYRILIKSIKRDDFLDELALHKSNIKTIYKGMRINENVSGSIIRRGDTLVVRGHEFIDSSDGYTKYMYGDELKKVYLIYYKEREVYLTNLYCKKTLKLLDNVLPFVSIATEDKEMIFSVGMEDYYLQNPKGKFSLYSLTDKGIKTEFEYVSTSDCNWMIDLPFWVRDNQLFYIHRILDSKGMDTGNHFYASMYIYKEN